jgi:hypothetical protein
VSFGRLRYLEHRSIPEIRTPPDRPGGGRVAERTVLNLLDRYDELLAVTLTDDRRLRRVLADQRRVIHGIDDLRPDVGHEVLWVVRDCLSGEILAAAAMLSARRKDLIGWLEQVSQACPVTAAGVVSDDSIRSARWLPELRPPAQDVFNTVRQRHRVHVSGHPTSRAARSTGGVTVPAGHGSTKCRRGIAVRGSRVLGDCSGLRSSRFRSHSSDGFPHRRTARYDPQTINPTFSPAASSAPDYTYARSLKKASRPLSRFLVRWRGL